jgi:hypothetical protein
MAVFPKKLSLFESSSGTSTSQVLEISWGSSQKRFPESICYPKLLRKNGPSLGGKSRKTVRVEGRVCYGKLLRDLPRGVLRRGHKFYYRHTVPVDAQRLLNRLEIWRSLRTDSLAVALRRLPGVVARIEMEIQHARAMAGLPVDAMLIRPSSHDPAEHPMPIPTAQSPAEIVQSERPLTLGEAYRSYIDDPTRAWTANTRETYETTGSSPLP